MDYQCLSTKKYFYVKQHVMESIKNGQSKVLINPNFMKPPVVHFNPHFKANLTIHVNPNVLKLPVESTTAKSPAIPLEKEVVPQLITPNNKVLNVHSQSPMKDKYKVINSNTATKQKHRFRIDNRRTSKVSCKKINKRMVNSVNTKNVYVKCNKKVNQKSLLNNNVKVKKTGHCLMIGEQRYKLGANNRTLTLLSNKSSRSTNKITAVNSKHNRYVKNNIGKRLIPSHAKHKTINVVKNKLKKSNLPCPFFRKFGKCKGMESGMCIRKHNAEQVSVCPKFLQGACLDANCLLSHKVSMEKMPTCRFYLDGLCFKDGCPYLHVKINAKAEICRDFLEGFCKKGAECDKRHQYLCPDFEQKGICRRKKCQFPHKTVVRDSKILNSVLPKLQTQVKESSKLKPCPTTKGKVPEKLLPLRYYDESLPKCIKLEHKMDETNQVSADSIEINSNYKPVMKRPTLGDLPAFIPFMVNEESAD